VKLLWASRERIQVLLEIGFGLVDDPHSTAGISLYMYDILLLQKANNQLVQPRASRSQIVQLESMYSGVFLLK
jgi:hypothetical protein